jgi:hypothetical protein
VEGALQEVDLQDLGKIGEQLDDAELPSQVASGKANRQRLLLATSSAAGMLICRRASRKRTWWPYSSMATRQVSHFA